MMLRMNRSSSAWTMSVLALTLVAALGGCVSRPSTTRESPSGSAPAVGVVMREFEFEPRPLVAKAGRVRFQLMNRGSVEHDFAIPTAQAHEEHERHLLKPGETRTVEIDLAPGTYEVVCTVPGHKEAGMVVTIEVRL